MMYICMYSPPDNSPSTTVLGPYIAMGSLSPAKFYHVLAQIYASSRKYNQPPVSLHGQMLFREYFYLCATMTPNFGAVIGNPDCRQIPWASNPALLEAWTTGKTGYPFIDAIMIQLNQDGWIHHLARHAVACFLTRGDLWQSWTAGAKVFERLLLDGDWALNNANWQWLSCSRFFYQYGRCYSPVAFGRKTDPKGGYIRHWIPMLARYPDKYIYEPWLAPISVQREAGCIIGVDYPGPIVDHTVVSKSNMSLMSAAYAQHKLSPASSEQPDETDNHNPHETAAVNNADKYQRPSSSASVPSQKKRPANKSIIDAYFAPGESKRSKKS